MKNHISTVHTNNFVHESEVISMNTNSVRILAQDQFRNNNTRETGLNNNDLVIGPSGAGKTRSYVKPNLMQCNESVIVADTKGSLLGEVGPLLKKQGYRVINIDFTNMLSSYGYNPLDYIRYDAAAKKYSEQDIMTITTALVPIEDPRQAIWEQHARQYMATLIGYVLERLPENQHTLEYVAKLMSEMGTEDFGQRFEELSADNPNSFASKKYSMIRGIQNAEKMHESIRGILAEKLDPLTYDGPLQMYSQPEKVDFAALGREKTAVFLTVSDTDRSCDRLVNLFYIQALQALCRSADLDYSDHRLPVPVRLILDDFATNAEIPDFDKIISVIRSREIYVSIILQSLTQLKAIYGEARALTIVNNCDNCLYLGGLDVYTAEHFAKMADIRMISLLNLSLGDAYLFTRGGFAEKVRKFDIKSHERYHDLPEAAV